MNRIKDYFSRLPFFIALRLFIYQIFRKLLFRNSKLEFAFAGENSILDNYFQYRTKGFYIDVGCNHPIKSSNTFLLYTKGWNGIVIDANEKLISEFRRVRKNDIVVRAAVSDVSKEVNYYSFDADLLNTINDNVGEGVKSNYNIQSVETITTKSLNLILEENNIASGTQIDLLSVDVEGHDFNVIKSLDFEQHKPKLIIVEIHYFDFENPEGNEIYNYLKDRRYKLIGYISMNAYFEYIGKD